MSFLPYLSGALAGALNGLFGTGGGIVLVPLLLRLHRRPVQRAFATSLAVILPLSAVTLLLNLRQTPLDWQAALPYLLGGGAGGFLAGKWLKKLPVLWLRRLFGALLLVSGIRSVLS